MSRSGLSVPRLFDGAASWRGSEGAAGWRRWRAGSIARTTTTFDAVARGLEAELVVALAGHLTGSVGPAWFLRAGAARESGFYTADAGRRRRGVAAPGRRMTSSTLAWEANFIDRRIQLVSLKAVD